MALAHAGEQDSEVRLGLLQELPTKYGIPTPLVAGYFGPNITRRLPGPDALYLVLRELGGGPPNAVGEGPIATGRNSTPTNRR